MHCCTVRRWKIPPTFSGFYPVTPTPEFAKNLIASIYHFNWDNWTDWQTFIHHSWVLLRENLASWFSHKLISDFQNSAHTSISSCASRHNKDKKVRLLSRLQTVVAKESFSILMVAPSNIDSSKQLKESKKSWHKIQPSVCRWMLRWRAF